MGQCYCIGRKCKHLTHLVRSYPGKKVAINGPLYTACKAFPNGVPFEIRNGDDPHYDVRDDQEGDWTYKGGQKVIDWKDTKIVLLPEEKVTATKREV